MLRLIGVTIEVYLFSWVHLFFFGGMCTFYYLLNAVSGISGGRGYITNVFSDFVKLLVMQPVL